MYDHTLGLAQTDHQFFNGWLSSLSARLEHLRETNDYQLPVWAVCTLSSHTNRSDRARDQLFDYHATQRLPD